MSPRNAASALPLLALLSGMPARAFVNVSQCVAQEGLVCSDDPEEAVAAAETGGPEVAAPLPALARRPWDAQVKEALGEGNWGVNFVLIAPDQTALEMASMNADVKMTPASTMKIFTGWFGFIKDLTAPKVFPAPFRNYASYAATMVKASVNAMAMRVLKLFGGKTAMQRYYDDLGLGPHVEVYDGAGLSVRNKATPNGEVMLLRMIRASEHYSAFRALMAEPGGTGTLHGRLRPLNGMLYAKTGTLPNSGVASLAGFLEVGPRGTVAFSIIGNNRSISIERQRARIDAAVEAVYRSATAEQAQAVMDARAVPLPDRIGERVSALALPLLSD